MNYRDNRYDNDIRHARPPIFIVAAQRNVRLCLFDGDGLGQVAGLVDIVALGLGDGRCEHL